VKSYVYKILGFKDCDYEECRNGFPVRYELGFYIPEDGILHSHRLETLKSYIALTGWAL
jgi:hypothetical protein